MSSKKGKKNKGTTVSLQAFNAQLEDGNAPNSGQNVVYATKKQTFTNWADEMDEEELITEKERILLPSAPRASRGPNIDDSLIPRQAPFTAHVSNIAYEIGDEEVYNFFRDMKIASIRIPREPGNRAKGYAYVDFETREDLINALAMSDQHLKGRTVRITVGDSHNRRDGGSGRGPGGGSYADATPNDWRSDMRAGSPPRLDGPGGGGGGFNDFRRGNDFNRGGDFERGRDRDRGFGGGEEMTRDQMTGGRRGGYNDFQSERGDRDNFQRDRSGSNNSMDSSWRSERAPPPPLSEPAFVRNSYGGGGPVRDVGRDMDYSGMRVRDDPPMRSQDSRSYGGYDRRPASPPRGGYDEDRGRRGYSTSSRHSRDDSPPMYRNTNTNPPPPQPPSEQSDEPQRERKKLVLAPRTVTSQIAEPAPETSSAIFGGAKPVDTAAREKEIEEKIMSLDVRSTSTRTRTDSQGEEPRIRILQRTPEERDKRDREIKIEKERKQRERFPSTSDGPKELQQPRFIIPEEPPKTILPRRSPTTTTTIPSLASSFCSENFHPNNISPPSSKHFQRSDDEDGSVEGNPREDKRPEPVQNEIIEPVKNPWTRRSKETREEDTREGLRRPPYDSDRKTPDFDRNSEKEKDTNSDPEDDRDANHRFINEDLENKEADDDDEFHVVSKSRPRRDKESLDKGFDGSRGDRRGGGGGRGPGHSERGGYGGPRGMDGGVRRGGGDRGDGPRRGGPYGRAGGEVGGGGGRRGGYGMGSAGGPPPRDR